MRVQFAMSRYRSFAEYARSQLGDDAKGTMLDEGEDEGNKHQKLVQAGQYPSFPQLGFGQQTNGASLLPDVMGLAGFMTPWGAIDGNSLPTSSKVTSELSALGGSSDTYEANSGATEGLSVARISCGVFREHALSYLQEVAYLPNVPSFIHTYQGSDRNGMRSFSVPLSLFFVNWCCITSLYQHDPPTFMLETLRKVHPGAVWPNAASHPDDAERMDAREHAIINAMRALTLFGILRGQASNYIPGKKNDPRTLTWLSGGRQRVVNIWAYTPESLVPGSKLYVLFVREMVHIHGHSQKQRIVWWRPHVVPAHGLPSVPSEKEGVIESVYIGEVTASATDVAPRDRHVYGEHEQFNVSLNPKLAAILTANKLGENQFQRLDGNNSYKMADAQNEITTELEQNMSDLGIIEIAVDIQIPTYEEHAVPMWTGKQGKGAAPPIKPPESKYVVNADEHDGMDHKHSPQPAASQQAQAPATGLVALPVRPPAASSTRPTVAVGAGIAPSKKPLKSPSKKKPKSRTQQQQRARGDNMSTDDTDDSDDE